MLDVDFDVDPPGVSTQPETAVAGMAEAWVVVNQKARYA
jgi:hypothetical protein